SWPTSRAAGRALACSTGRWGNVGLRGVLLAAGPPAQSRAGGRGELKGKNPGEPVPNAYADFLGDPSRVPATVRGTWWRVVSGCGPRRPTDWKAITWEADLPAGTSVRVRARTGDTAIPDGTWGPWSAVADVS